MNSKETAESLFVLKLKGKFVMKKKKKTPTLLKNFSHPPKVKSELPPFLCLKNIYLYENPFLVVRFSIVPLIW